MAKVRVNGREISLKANVKTVLDFVLTEGLIPDDVVVEYNSAILPRAYWGKTKINEGDRLEILSFVGGG